MSDDLRSAIALAHGLDQDAATFLTGETIEQLEQSADQLARLVETHHQESEPAPQVDPITAALQDKARRKRELADTIIGRPRQPRDEHGRYASTGFDGGARASLPRPKDPEAEHGRVVLQLARMRALGGSFPAN
jgi:hypothetical protein